MINAIGGRERDRVMAVLADVGCLNVGRILAGSVCTVMAARTITGDVYVIEVGRNPA